MDDPLDLLDILTDQPLLVLGRQGLADELLGGAGRKEGRLPAQLLAGLLDFLFAGELRLGADPGDLDGGGFLQAPRLGGRLDVHLRVHPGDLVGQFRGADLDGGQLLRRLRAGLRGIVDRLAQKIASLLEKGGERLAQEIDEHPGEDEKVDRLLDDLSPGDVDAGHAIGLPRTFRAISMESSDTCARRSAAADSFSAAIRPFSSSTFRFVSSTTTSTCLRPAREVSSMTRRFRASASAAPLRRASSYPRAFSSASDRSWRDSSIGFTERFSLSSNVRRIGLMRRVERRNARTTTRPSWSRASWEISSVSKILLTSSMKPALPRGRTGLRKDIYKRNGRLVPRPPRNCQGLLDGQRAPKRQSKKGAGETPAPFLEPC